MSKGGNQPSLEIQKQVRTMQSKLRKLQESGLPLYKGYSNSDGKSRIYPHRQGNTLDMWKRRYDALDGGGSIMDKSTVENMMYICDY